MSDHHLEGVFDVVGVEVAESGAADERGDEQQVRQRHHEQSDVRALATLRVHGAVAHVAGEHVEHDRNARQVREHGRQEVAAVAAAASPVKCGCAAVFRRL